MVDDYSLCMSATHSMDDEGERAFLLVLARIEPKDALVSQLYWKFLAGATKPENGYSVEEIYRRMTVFRLLVTDSLVFGEQTEE